MVISDTWECYKEYAMVKATRVRELAFDDIWWDKIDFILSFTVSTCDMIIDCDTDKPFLYLVCDMGAP